MGIEHFCPTALPQQRRKIIMSVNTNGISSYAEALAKDAKTLSNRDLDYLLDKLQEEQDDRKADEARRDWQVVCEAIDNFTSKHGSLFVQENSNPLVVEGINLLPGKYSTEAFGVITAKH
jgi:hypothetical protein